MIDTVDMALTLGGTALQTGLRRGSMELGQDLVETALTPAARGEPFAFGSGTRQLRAEQLITEAARASGYHSPYTLVDEIVYDAGASSPSFWVTQIGQRVITIDPSTFGKTRAGQLIAGTHEFGHAEHFGELVAQSGVAAARKSFFVSPTTHRYAIREVMTESQAITRVERFLGGVTPQQRADSTKYMSFWSKRGGVPEEF